MLSGCKASLSMLHRLESLVVNLDGGHIAGLDIPTCSLKVVVTNHAHNCRNATILASLHCILQCVTQMIHDKDGGFDLHIPPILPSLSLFSLRALIHQDIPPLLFKQFTMCTVYYLWCTRHWMMLSSFAASLPHPTAEFHYHGSRLSADLSQRIVAMKKTSSSLSSSSSSSKRIDFASHEQHAKCYHIDIVPCGHFDYSHSANKLGSFATLKQSNRLLFLVRCCVYDDDSLAACLLGHTDPPPCHYGRG